MTVVSASLEPKQRTIEEEIGGITVVRLRSEYLNIPYLPLPFVVMHGLNRKIKEIGADIYHINNRYQFLPNNIRPIKRLGGKTVLTIHNALPAGINAFTDKAGLVYDVVSGRWVMNLCDMITGVSRNAILSTVPKKSLKKSHVVFNEVITTPSCQGPDEQGGEDDHERVRAQGRDNPYERAIDPPEGADLHDGGGCRTGGRQDLSMLIVGRGYLKEELFELSTKMGLDGRFGIVSGLTEKELSYHCNSASVFVLPSLYEPASIALLEALSSSIPAIASKTGGIPEMMKDTGYYVRAKDSVAIRKRIEYIMENRKSAERLAQKSRRLMIKEHDWDKIARQYEALFESLL